MSRVVPILNPIFENLDFRASSTSNPMPLYIRYVTPVLKEFNLSVSNIFLRVCAAKAPKIIARTINKIPNLRDFNYLFFEIKNGFSNDRNTLH